MIKELRKSISVEEKMFWGKFVQLIIAHGSYFSISSALDMMLSHAT